MGMVVKANRHHIHTNLAHSIPRLFAFFNPLIRGNGIITDKRTREGAINRRAFLRQGGAVDVGGGILRLRGHQIRSKIAYSWPM